MPARYPKASRTPANVKAEFGKPPQRPKRSSWLEERIADFLVERDLPRPVREFRFARPRLYRFDFAWPALGLALELEGGIWIQGGHTRGAAYADDCDKYNLATLNGWRVLRVTDRQIRDRSAFDLLQRALTTEIRYVPSVLIEVNS